MNAVDQRKNRLGNINAVDVSLNEIPLSRKLAYLRLILRSPESDLARPCIVELTPAFAKHK